MELLTSDKLMHVMLIKRHGRTEAFDERKLYGSIYAACLATRIVEEKAEKIAASVCKEIEMFLRGKKKITTDEIFLKAGEALEKLDSRAAFLYKTHRDIT